MISIKFKIGTILLALAAAYLLVSSHAFASTISITGTTITHVTITIPTIYENNGGSYCIFQNGISLGCSSNSDFIGANPQTQNLVTDWFANSNESLSVQLVVTDSTLAGECSTSVAACLAFSGILDHATYSPSTLPAAPLGFPNILGSTSPGDLMASVSGGVQETGKSMWPLTVFLGIATAFIIAGLVVQNIKQQVKPTKGFNMAEFDAKADELQEFYSKTGGADPAAVETIKRQRKR